MGNSKLLLPIAALGILFTSINVNALECIDVNDCVALGYSTEDTTGCAEYIKCPYNTAYKKCVNKACEECQNKDYTLASCPGGATCDAKYKITGCPTFSLMTPGGGITTYDFKLTNNQCTLTSTDANVEGALLGYDYNVDNVFNNAIYTLLGCKSSSPIQTLHTYTLESGTWNTETKSGCFSSTAYINTISMDNVKSYSTVIDNGKLKFKIEECEDGASIASDKKSCEKPVEADERCDDIIDASGDHIKYFEIEVEGTIYRLCCNPSALIIGPGRCLEAESN